MSRVSERFGWISASLLGFVVVILAGPAFFYVQRWNALGIMTLGGAKYWVGRAKAAPDPSEAKVYLRFVLAATQYGVNGAENAVGALPDVRDRVRLFGLLMEVAPNDNWRGIYSRDLERQRGLLHGGKPPVVP